AAGPGAAPPVAPARPGGVDGLAVALGSLAAGGGTPGGGAVADRTGERGHDRLRLLADSPGAAGGPRPAVLRRRRLLPALGGLALYRPVRGLRRHAGGGPDVLPLRRRPVRRRALLAAPEGGAACLRRYTNNGRPRPGFPRGWTASVTACATGNGASCWAR